MAQIDSLADHLERLLARFDTAGKPPHTRVVFLDCADLRVRYVAGPDHGWRCPPEALSAPESFAARFEALQRAGYSWINLSLYGVRDAVLIVGVELPAAPADVPPGKTAINYSGPSLDPRTGERSWLAPVHVERQA